MDERYEKVSRPPEGALKTIAGGRLKGMTDIRPQWRIQAMTETYGLCGLGWRYAIDRLWTEDGPNGEKMAFALVTVQIKEGAEWSAPIPGIGGSSLIDREREGLRCDDEGYKMAVTDALGVAFKALGVASAIHMGQWDGTKYRDNPPPSPKAPQGSTQKPPEASSPYEARLKAAWTTLEALKPGLTEEDKAAVDKGVASLKVDGKIPRTEAGAAALEKMAESWKPRAKAGKLAAFEDDIPWEGESA